jgi:hypothetical protein
MISNSSIFEVLHVEVVGPSQSLPCCGDEKFAFYSAFSTQMTMVMMNVVWVVSKASQPATVHQFQNQNSSISTTSRTHKTPGSISGLLRSKKKPISEHQLQDLLRKKTPISDIITENDFHI